MCSSDLIGVSSAYLGGTYDILVQRVVDAWISFPALVIVLSLVAALGPGLLNLILALSILGAAGTSRVIRGAALSTMQNPYVEAARALGSGHWRIILRHVLPNVLATVIIVATIGLGTVILAESALSFLGFGIPPPYPSWGGMLSGSGRSFMYRAPWMALFPGAAISLAVFGFNMFGDALRDLLDPRLRGGGGRPTGYQAGRPRSDYFSYLNDTFTRARYDVTLPLSIVTSSRVTSPTRRSRRLLAAV